MFSEIALWWWTALGLLTVVTLVHWLLRGRPAAHVRKQIALLGRLASGQRGEIVAELDAAGVRFYRERSGEYALGRDGRRHLVAERPAAFNPAMADFPAWAYAGAFTALGLIGTFVGLHEAAQVFQDAIDSTGRAFEPTSLQQAQTDMQQAQSAAVTGFVEAMGNAFGTSIVGLVCAAALSVLTTWIPRVRGSHASKALQAFFDANFEVVSPTDLLYRGQEGDLAAAADKLGAGAGRLADAAAKLDSEVMAQIVSSSIERSLGPVLGDIHGALRALHEQNRAQTTDVLERLVAELRDQVLHPMAEAVRENTRQNEVLRERVQALVVELPKVTGAVATSAASMERFATKTQQDLEQFTVSLEGVLVRFTSKSQVVFSQIPGQVESALQEVRRDIQIMLSSTRDAFEQQSDSFRQFTDSSQRQMREFTEDSQRRMEEIRDGSVALMKEQHANLQAIAVESARVMTSAREELVAGIHVIPEMLETTQRVSQAQLRRFQEEALAQMDTFRTEYQGHLSAFFEQQSIQLEETLGRQREGLSRVVDELTQAYRDEAERRNDLGAQVDGQLGRLGDTLGKLQELSAAMTTWMPRVSADLSATQLTAVEHVVGMREMLERIVRTQNEQMQLITSHHATALQGLAETTERMRTELDASVAEICNNLAGVALMLLSGKERA